jgi:DNA-binding beta-propeller fold protein YncE
MGSPTGAAAIAVGLLLVVGAVLGSAAGVGSAAPPTRAAAPRAADLGPSSLARAEPGSSAQPHPYLDAGHVARTVFVNYNASIPGGFASTVADWYLGPGAYVPSTGRLWLPNLDEPVEQPMPPSAPAVLFDPTTNSFTGVVPALSNVSDLVYDPQNGYLYAAQPFTDSVGVFNPSTGTWAAPPIPVGHYPYRMVLDAQADLLFVANLQSDNITAVNTSTQSVYGSGISLFAAPIDLAYDNANNSLFVAYLNSSSLSIFNASTYALLAAPVLPGDAGGIAIASQADTVAVSSPLKGSLTLLNASSYLTIFGFLSVGKGVGAVTSVDSGTEFLLANSSGSDLRIVNATSGAVSSASITVGQGPTSFDRIGGTTYAWATGSHVLTAVWSLNASQSTFSPSLTAEPTAVAWDPSINSTVVGDTDGSSLSFVAAQNLTPTAAAMALPSAPVSLAPVQGSSELLAGLVRGLAEVNLSTRSILNISTTGGADQAVLYDPATGLVWTLNAGQGLLAYRVSNLSLAFSVGIGGLSGIESMALDPTTDQLFVPVNDSGVPSIAIVDAANGTVSNGDAASVPGVTSVAFDPADNTVYALGANLSLLNATTGLPLPRSILLAPHGISGTIVYDSAREALYATTFSSPGEVGTVTAIDGRSVPASYSGASTIPVGQSPSSLTVVPGPGNATGSEIWVANLQSGTLSVIANSPPRILGFSAASPVIDLGERASFTVSATGGAGPLRFAYSGLPPGCSSADAPVLSCTPLTTGAFNVTVVVTDSLGGNATAETAFTVGTALSVVGTFGVQTFPVVDVGYPFSMLAAGQGGVAPYTYVWSFGDGTNGTGAGSSHLYTAVGDYVLTVTVTDSVRATVSASWAVTVVPDPSIAIASSASTTDVGVPISLAAAIAGGSGSNDTGFWDFGDGTTSTGFEVTHAWGAPGVYNVSATYVDGMGVTAHATTQVRVNAAPTGEFSVSGGTVQQPAVPGTVFYYNATIVNGTAPFVITWNFGDGTFATGPRILHSYSAAGTYSVNVSIRDAAGALVNGTLSVTVDSPAPPSSTGNVPGVAFDLGLFLGVVLGVAMGAVLVFAADHRRRRPPAAPPTATAPPPARPAWTEEP